MAVIIKINCYINYSITIQFLTTILQSMTVFCMIMADESAQKPEAWRKQEEKLTYCHVEGQHPASLSGLMQNASLVAFLHSKHHM